MSNTATTTRTQAEEYNAGVVQALATAEAVAAYLGSYHACELGDPIADALDGTNVAYGDFVAALAEIGDEDDATPADALAPYFTDALAIEAIGKHDGTAWTVTGVEVTVTSGGPNTWLTWNGNRSGWITVTTAWGSDRATETVEACRLADMLAEWADTIEG